MSKITLTNMVMIHDTKIDKMLVLNRKKSWKGLAFPGGHIEVGESFIDSANREVKEETGLDVWDLKSCGTINLSNEETGDRFVVLLYKTTKFSGEIIQDGEEGDLRWMTFEEIENFDHTNTFYTYLPMFKSGDINEGFAVYGKPKKSSDGYNSFKDNGLRYC